MIEHAGHHVAIDRVEHQYDVQDKQWHVALARIFQDQHRHYATHEQIGRIPVAGPLRAERIIFSVHVEGDGERKSDVDRSDDVIGRRRQARIQIVFAQTVEDEQHIGDRNQCHRQERRAAFAGPEIKEEIKKEEDRHGVINALDNKTRPLGGIVCHGALVGMNSNGGRPMAPALSLR